MRNDLHYKAFSFLIVIVMLFSITPLTAKAGSIESKSGENQQQNTKANISLSGTIKDGSAEGGTKHGYPLYAKITLTGPEGDQIFYSDPFTGNYQTAIQSGVEYTITVEAFLNGYQTATETFIAEADISKNFDLYVSPACTAPGYQPVYDQLWDFEESAGEMTFGGQNSSWAWGEFASGPGAAHSGTKGIATNLTGTYNLREQSWAMSPVINLSDVPATKTPVLEWWNWLYTESPTNTFDVASVEFTVDGTTWYPVWGPYPRQDTEYVLERLIIPLDFRVATFQFRFWFKSDYAGVAEGWYIDDIGLMIANVDTSITPVASYFFDDPNEEAWTTGKTGTGNNSWAVGVPSNGPGAAFSAPNVWATNLTGNYNGDEVSYITSPVLDMSANDGKEVIVNWKDWMWVESATSAYDEGRVYASTDGGETWTKVIESIFRQDKESQYTAQSLRLPQEYAVQTFRFRFEFKSDTGTFNYPGWYIDDVQFGFTPPMGEIGKSCEPVPGAIVAGWVYDLHQEDLVILDALVETDATSGMTQLRPDDSENDGLYYFYQSLTESVQEVSFTVSKDSYTTVTENRSIHESTVSHQDFQIGSGWLVVSPASAQQEFRPGDEDILSILTLTNVGSLPVTWSLQENNQDSGELTLTEKEASPEGVAADIPWLEASPAEGVLEPGASVEILLTWSVEAITQPGECTGTLNISNAPNPDLVVPVRLRLLSDHMLYFPMIATE